MKRISLSNFSGNYRKNINTPIKFLHKMLHDFLFLKHTFHRGSKTVFTNFQTDVQIFLYLIRCSSNNNKYEYTDKRASSGFLL